MKIKFLLLSTLLLLPCLVRGAVTVTDSQGVIYDIIGNTMTVKVSQNNRNYFINKSVDIVIPAQVRDVATTAVTDEPYQVVGIDAEAFRGTTVTSFTLEASLATLPANCFQGCLQLQTVELNGHVTEIGNNCFQNATALQGVHGIGTLEKLGSAAFQNCSSLTDIAFTDALSSIGAQCFEKCTSLQAMEIPSGVQTLPNKVFNGCTSLKTLTLHEGLSKIDYDACSGCTLLEAPAFPATLTQISNNAFKDCASLGILTLTPGVKILSHAFAGSGISQIIWPADALTLESSVFYQVHALQAVTLPGWFATLPGNLFEAAADLRQVTLEDGVNAIGNRCFYNCKQLESLTLGASVTVIGESAFEECNRLADVAFPSVMERIGTRAFWNCRSFSHLVLPAGASVENGAFHGTELTSITWPERAMGTLATSPFGSNQTVQQMDIPEWMQTTPLSMCNNWPSLKSVTFADGCSEIANMTFSNCPLLETVSLPSTLQKIGDNAFEGCTLLTGLTFPEGLLSIGNYGFYRNSAMTGLALPSSLTSLGNCCFSQCGKLSAVTFAEGSALTVIPMRCFDGDGALVDVTWPQALREIGDMAFQQCTRHVARPFPNTLVKIGVNAFNYNKAFGPLTLYPGMQVCTEAFNQAGVTQIDFPDEPCSFGDRVFLANDIITSITLPEWMSVIPTGLCKQWTVLDQIHFPSGLVEIGDEAFRLARCLHDLEFPASLRKIGRYAFSEICDHQPQFGEVVLYEGCEIGDNAFANTTVTSLRFVGCAEFGKDVFSNVTTIASVAFPECMTEIPDGFCKSWKNLHTVTLPSSLRSIGKDCFYECFALTALDLSSCENLTEIGETAYKKAGITSIIWPGHALDLGKGAFQETQIQSLTIPAWMTSVSEECFRGCPQLREILYEERTEPLTFGKNSFAWSALPAVSFPECGVVLGEGAFSVSKVASIEWPSQGLVLGTSAFNSTSLTEVAIPGYITSIPDNCFCDTRTLTRVDLGQGVLEVGNSAFSRCSIADLTLSPGLESIGYEGFSNNKFVTLELPASIRSIGGAFKFNRELEQVTMHPGLEYIGNEAFASCDKLLPFTVPDGVREIQAGAFGGCKALYTLPLPGTLEKIGWMAFKDSGLRYITLPASLTLLDSESFKLCYSLEEVVSEATTLEIGKESFQYDNSLVKFTSKGNVTRIREAAFDRCNALQEWIYEGTQPIQALHNACFAECYALRQTPPMVSNDMGSEVFHNCTTLKQVTLPAGGTFPRTGWGGYDYLAGCTSLQSLVWPATGKEFSLKYRDLAGAPLQALSYSYAGNIDYPYTGHTSRSINQFDTNSVPAGHDPSGSILMVMRGQKWKYMEAGYGAMFDIREMRDPQFNIEGGIFSTFDPEANVNHYKASLRWDVPLSDLNPEGDTHVHIYRDDTLLADVLFSKPSGPMHVEGLTADSVIAVDVKMRRTGEDEYTPTSFAGDFYFPVAQPDGSTIYEMQYNVTESTMYFDAVTEKRQVAFDKYGYTSWFTFVDEFDSPALDSGQVPLSYAYSAKMDAYNYQEPENNPGLEPGDDGLRWHTVQKSTADMQDGYVLMYTAMAMPTLTGDGIYTFDQIQADRDRSLLATDPGRLQLSYAIEPALLAQRGKIDNSVEYMFNQLQTWYEDPDTGRRQVGTVNLTGTNASGNVAVSADAAPAPGRRYQTIVGSRFRGTFGSPTLTVPGAPLLEASVTADKVDAATHSAHPEVPTFATRTALQADVTPMGYTPDNPVPQAHRHLGLWRTITPTLPVTPAAMHAPALDSEELVHHIDGRTEECTESQCTHCAGQTGLVTNDEGTHYADTFDTEWDTAYTATYTPRLYVKVPSTMLPAQEAWMLADSQATVALDIPTGILPIPSIEDGKCLWFTLDGLPIHGDPAPGMPLLRVTSAGVEKVIL